jgi:hypothetical protein
MADLETVVAKEPFGEVESMKFPNNILQFTGTNRS